MLERFLMKEKQTLNTEYPGKFFVVATAVTFWMPEKKYSNGKILPVCSSLVWNSLDRLWLWIQKGKLAAALTEK